MKMVVDSYFIILVICNLQNIMISFDTIVNLFGE